MTAIAASRLSRRSFRILAVLSVVHALLVLVIWVAAFYADFAPFSGAAWLIFAWLWLAWPLLLALHPAGTRRTVFVAILLGAVLLVPCTATIFLFTAWKLEGFAS